MSYGFISINDSRYVQVDSDTPRLCLIEKGSYAGASFTVTVNFSAPIQSVEPPLVFIRPSVRNTNELYGAQFLNGSAGNWTGFTIRSMNQRYLPTGDWFVAIFGARASAKFGMRIWDGLGTLIYDSGSPPVVVTTILSNWTYVGKVTQPDYGAYYKWVAGRGLSPGEYFCLNDFALGMQDANGGGSSCAISNDYTNNQICIWAFNSTTFIPVPGGHRPVIFAKLTA
jgi:hypothetical protein